jgi:hypothetical protein
MTVRTPFTEEEQAAFRAQLTASRNKHANAALYIVSLFEDGHVAIKNKEVVGKTMEALQTIVTLDALPAKDGGIRPPQDTATIRKVQLPKA